MKRENWAALDGLRGLSILSVVAVHLWAHSSRTGSGIPIGFSFGTKTIDLTWIFATAHNAVTIFLVLSGFLLYRHWIEKAASGTPFLQMLPDFYAKRLRRIAPAFVFFLVVYFVLVLALGKHRFGADVTPINLFVNLTFLSSWTSLTGGILAPQSLDIIPGTWSLNAEIWFYLALPFVAYALSRVRLSVPGLAVIAGLFAAYRHALPSDAPFTLQYNFLGVGDAFFIGMFVAWFSARGFIRHYLSFLFPLGLILYVGQCSGSVHLIPDGRLQLSISSALMIAGLVSDGDSIWKRVLSAKWLTHTGHISYSMFLCNILVAWYIVLPVSQALGDTSTEETFALNFLIGFPLIYVISNLVYRYVERPFMTRSVPFALRPTIRVATGIVVASVVPACLAYAIRPVDQIEFKGSVPSMAVTPIGRTVSTTACASAKAGA